jgi:hypothetical protein
VFRRKGLPIPVRCVLFAFIPHVWVGIGVIVAVLWVPAMALFGHDTTATVVSRTLIASKGTHCLVTYAYEESGRRFTDKESFAPDAYRRFAPGTTFPVRSLHVFGLGSSHRTDDSPLPGFAGLLFFGLFWNGVLFTLFLTFCLAPLLERRLLRDGEATIGRITGKRVNRGKSTTYHLAYRGLTADGTELIGEMSVDQADYNAAQVGEEVLILCDPLRPRRSVLYKYSQYAVRDMYGYEAPG